MNIEKTKCCIPKKKKINEIIDALNPLLNIELKRGSYLDVQYSQNNVVLTIPDENLLPDGYEEELLDVVDASNTAGQRYFLTRSA